jgi:hypothetical protein
MFSILSDLDITTPDSNSQILDSSLSPQVSTSECHILWLSANGSPNNPDPSPSQSEDFSLPPFILPGSFLSEGNSFGSVDWPPIGSSLLPEHGNARQDGNTSLRSPVSDVPPRPPLIDLITYERPRRTGMTRSFCVGRHCCRRSRNWMNLKFWREIHHLTVTACFLAQKSPRQSLIPPFRDAWYPTTIAGFGVCPNEAAPPMHRQSGHYPPLGRQQFPLVNVKSTSW